MNNSITSDVETLLGKVSHTIIKRVNFPKTLAGKMTRKASLNAKSRPLLSHHDCEEVTQTCALVLVASGAFERGNLTFSDWKACFRGVRSKGCLRIETGHCKADATDIATMHEASASDAIGCAIGQFYRVDKALTNRRQAIARRIRYTHACLLAQFAIDSGRQRKGNFRKALRYLRYLASQFSAGMGEVEILDCKTQEAAYMARETFRRYCKQGEISLDASEDARMMQSNLQSLTHKGALQRL